MARIICHYLITEAVRIPYVIGEDDFTKRLYFYVEHIIRGRPMNIDNIDEKLGFIFSEDAGGFWTVVLK